MWNAGVQGRALGALTLWYLGLHDRAQIRCQENLQLAPDFINPSSHIWALTWAAILYQHRRQCDAVDTYAEEAISLATRQGFEFWISFGTMLKGWALVIQEQSEEGIKVLQSGLAGYRKTGAELGRSYFLGLLAEAYASLELIPQALEVLEEALGVVECHQEHFYSAELRRLQGAFILGLPEPDFHRAESCFYHARKIAQRQQAKSLELRAVMSLSQLWQQRENFAEAHAILAQVYNGFTEGFDTADLVMANVLLEELKAKM